MARPVRLHLSWRRNGDSLDIALAANSLLAHNHPVWWCLKLSGPVEPGDYLVEGPPGLAARLAGLGLTAAPWPGRLPLGAQLLDTPRVSLLAGRASAYPYFAYYSLCLTRLGLRYDPLGGPEIARGAMHGANLFVLPGGFATWGLDTAEAAPGADAAVRAFLETGGGCIGSCGGAYYLSAGRPGWTGTAWTRPRYTHEYLQSGTGIVSLRLTDHVLGLGCPATGEMPYFHGPVYDEAGGGTEVAAVFHSLCLPGRLAIDNPLESRRFRREMVDRPAILRARGRRGRAVLFSPHPEMGDLVRKYVALDGYVRRYVSIRGQRTMEETLQAYKPLESPAFRLVLNAVHSLMLERAGRRPRYAPEPARGGVHPVHPLSSLRLFQEAAREILASVRPPRSAGHAAVVRTVTEDLAGRLAPAANTLVKALRRLSVAPDAEGRRVLAAWDHLARRATEVLGQGRLSGRPVAERLMHVELAICLWDAWRRLIETELLLAPAGLRR